MSRRQVLGAGVQAASAVLLGSSGLRAGEAKADRKKGAGPATKPAAASGPAAVKDDLRCGIIGVGGRGSGLLKATDQAPGVRVTAICDIDADRLKAAAEKVQADQPRAFMDYHELVDFKELDAVFIATPIHLHAEMALAVLASGRSCYCEKPMGLTVKELNQVVNASKSVRGIYQIGTQLRYAHPWQSSIKFILSGEIGRPILIRAHRHNVGDLPHDRAWLFQNKYCGDTIVEQAVHELDLFNWIFGGIPVRAAGFGGQALRFKPEPRDIMDHYTLSLDYGKNKKVSYSHSWISSPKIPADGRQEIVYCEKGAVDIENGMVYPMDFGEPYKVDAGPEGDSTQLAVNDFFACVRERRRPLSDAEAGRNGTLTALLGRTAIYEGRVVTMEELLKQG